MCISTIDRMLAQYVAEVLCVRYDGDMAPGIQQYTDITDTHGTFCAKTPEGAFCRLLEMRAAFHASQEEV